MGSKLKSDQVSACFDRVDPRTGVSDCPSKKSLCTNPAYQRVLSEQCPLTCGKCPGVLPDPGKCFDRVDPRTGVSNCNKALCTNPAYKKVMEEQCPLTCNRCPGSLPNH
ncbi:unnamed protein product [Cylicostephanus goldi]|uniref:ShKT domain-containing protein n=1 Tax=Cylicostephanus goldi TaxID=71465 RepID=A0A3P6R3T1_CYLGO|nr:unnamed protein product [Cylicostephanus goldi]